MARPTIAIGAPQITTEGVEFNAEVAGYSIRVRMPAEFVDDEIGSNASQETIDFYFSTSRSRIEDAAWALAYAHSTSNAASAETSPVPYLSAVSARFAKLQVRHS